MEYALRYPAHRLRFPGSGREPESARSTLSNPTRPRVARATSGSARTVATPVTARAAALARFYDLDLLDDPGDLGLYLALATRTGGPILELAVGTGRLAVPLAQAGHAVTGVDRDAAMLARAADRAAAAGPVAAARLRLIEAEILGLALPGAPRFRLAILALNSLLLLADRASQAGVLRAMADHLEPGGLAVVDTWLPDADDLARYDGRLILEYLRLDGETGQEVTKMAAAAYDAATSTVELTAIYAEGAPGHPPARWTRQDRLRLVGADELRTLAEGAGLVVEVLAGGYDLTPLGPGAERAVLLARRPQGRPSARGRSGPRPPGLV
ncbi:MAG: methyltransferase domain-containing protein [Candidatus Limnocylindrales bacterium]